MSLTPLLLSLGIAMVPRPPKEDKAPVLWNPIPPAVWAMREADLPGDKGAVYLLRRLRVSDLTTLHEYRIRICSERGKGAAEFPPFPASAWGFVGRVVYPDGHELAFDSTLDFHTRTFLATGNQDFNATLLAPPGLTDDCVVDLRWQEPKYWPFAAVIGSGSERFDLAAAYPIQTLYLEVARDSSFSSTFADARLHVTRTMTDNQITLVVHDVPPVKTVPFATSVSREIPRLRLFVRNRRLQMDAAKGPQAFWTSAAGQIQEWLTKTPERGPGYLAFSATLREGLPEGPQAAARELAFRLRERLRRVEELSLEERARMPHKKADAKPSPGDLDALLKSGMATTNQMLQVYFNLLVDLGLKPRLMLVADRDREVLTPKEMNLNQVASVLVGISEPGRPDLWVEPHLALAQPGLIQAQYQAFPCMEIDSVTWMAKESTLPSQPPETNARRDTYRLEILPELDRFTMETDFLGCDDLAGKTAGSRLEPREQDRLLRERLETAPGTVVDKAQELDAKAPRKPHRWKVEGRVERASGRRRTVDPFPLTPLALDVPNELGDGRREGIVLPYLCERGAVSRFKLPPGYDCPNLPALSEENAFGSVRLTNERIEGPEGPEIQVALAVRVVTAIAGPDQWVAFKTFLGWIRQAGSTGLVLERKP